jgi:hypothetical protein
VGGLGLAFFAGDFFALAGTGRFFAGFAFGCAFLTILTVFVGGIVMGSNPES